MWVRFCVDLCVFAVCCVCVARVCLMRIAGGNNAKDYAINTSAITATKMCRRASESSSEPVEVVVVAVAT